MTTRKAISPAIQPKAMAQIHRTARSDHCRKTYHCATPSANIITATPAETIGACIPIGQSSTRSPWKRNINPTVRPTTAPTTVAATQSRAGKFCSRPRSTRTLSQPGTPPSTASAINNATEITSGAESAVSAPAEAGTAKPIFCRVFVLPQERKSPSDGRSEHAQGPGPPRFRGRSSRGERAGRLSRKRDRAGLVPSDRPPVAVVERRAGRARESRSGPSSVSDAAAITVRIRTLPDDYAGSRRDAQARRIRLRRSTVEYSAGRPITARIRVDPLDRTLLDRLPILAAHNLGFQSTSVSTFCGGA